MTNKENLQSMSLDELAEWLDANGQFDGSPWMEWFSKNYCNEERCPAEIVQYCNGDNKRDIEVSYCELEHKCKFFPDLPESPSNFEIIKMWLNEKYIDKKRTEN